MRGAVAALIIGLLASARLPAQGAIVSLLVIDDATDAPLAGVHVSIGVSAT